jgi:hypothetical protein
VKYLAGLLFIKKEIFYFDNYIMSSEIGFAKITKGNVMQRISHNFFSSGLFVGLESTNCKYVNT